MSIEHAVIEIQRSQENLMGAVGELRGLAESINDKLDAHVMRSDIVDKDHDARIASLEGTRAKAKGFLMAAGVPGAGAALTAKWESVKQLIGWGR